MKVLWLCNIMLPFIADSLGKSTLVKEGWLSGLAARFIKTGDDSGVELAICFPTTDLKSFGAKDGDLIYKGISNGIEYYAFYEDTLHPEIYDANLEKSLNEIIKAAKPDLVHIFGTEFPHTLAMCRAFDRPERILVGIQGVMTPYAKAYMAGLPKSVQDKKTFRDWLKKDSLREQEDKFFKRAENEKEALKLVGHVTGRTDFDKEWTSKLAPQARYHFMNETLRENFYTNEWDISKIERHSIFVSQGNYPIKGIHEALEVLPRLIEKYPDTKMYVAGDKITANKTLKDKIKISAYGKYIRGLLSKYHLEEQVEFVGAIDSKKMCSMYLKTHVFLCPSVIENSPNSVGEAMLVGEPVVAANVGGIHNLLVDSKEGRLYQYGDKEVMASAILNIFDNDELALEYSRAAKEHAGVTHNPATNFNRLLEIYNEINLCI